LRSRRAGGHKGVRAGNGGLRNTKESIGGSGQMLGFRKWQPGKIAYAQDVIEGYTGIFKMLPVKRAFLPCISKCIAKTEASVFVDGCAIHDGSIQYLRGNLMNPLFQIKHINNYDVRQQIAAIRWLRLWRSRYISFGGDSIKTTGFRCFRSDSKSRRESPSVLA